jgi:hypothetical protein
MDTPITYFKASDGTAALDMAEDMVSQPIRCGTSNRVSFQNAWGAGAKTGTFKLQFSNVPDPQYNSCWTDCPSDAMSTPTQPATAASDNILCVDSLGSFVREYYTATSGGTGVLPTGWYAQSRVEG